MKRQRSLPPASTSLKRRLDSIARSSGADVARRDNQGIQTYQASEQDTTIERIIEILIDATNEDKIIWFRDADWFLITYIPMLAVSFRFKLNNNLGGENPKDDPKADYLDISFMDNKDFRLMSSVYPRLHVLARCICALFTDYYVRGRNERLMWLEKALNTFLPYVKVASVEDPEM